MWIKRGSPQNIQIIGLDGLESNGYLRQIIYGKMSDRNYDGIHLRGKHAVRHFSYRTVQAIKNIALEVNSKD